MAAVRRVGSCLQVQDGDGGRHLLRVTSVQALSDTDPLRNEAFITAVGRTARRGCQSRRAGRGSLALLKIGGA